MIEMFAALIVGHVVCDYPLQGGFLARAKNRSAPVAGVPWQQALSAHAIMHGAAVWMITGHIWLGLAEVVAHAAIDDAKCTGKIGFNADQALHAACKVAWVGLTFIAAGAAA